MREGVPGSLQPPEGVELGAELGFEEEEGLGVEVGFADFVGFGVGVGVGSTAGFAAGEKMRSLVSKSALPSLDKPFFFWKAVRAR